MAREEGQARARRALTEATQDTRIPLLGVLASQSGFTLASMQHAVRSRAPLLLLHLEGGRPEGASRVEVWEEESGAVVSAVDGSGTEPGRESADQRRSSKMKGDGTSDGKGENGDGGADGKPEVHVTGAWWNRAFGSMIAECGVELRREIAGDGSTRVGVWTAGMRMGRYGPPL